MAVNTRLRPAASRGYWKWAGIFLLALVGLILVYRALTGSTLRDQKAEVDAQRAAQGLQALPPGNPESLSAKLEAARKEAEKQDRQEKPAASADPAPIGLSGSPPKGQDAPLAGPAGPVPGAWGTRDGRGLPRPGWGGAAGEAAVSDAELDDYARRKPAVAEPAAKSNLWTLRGNDTGASPAANATPATPVSTADGGAGASRTALPQLLDAYLKHQGASGTSAQPANSQAQFRAGLDRTAQVQEPLRVTPAAGRLLVMEGTSVPVVMEDDVSSDIAGRCRARVAHDVLDSASLSVVLIPAGARLICTYDAQVIQGQDKLLLAFTRLVFPNGASVALGGMEVADRYGAAGAPAVVDNRFWRIFGSSFLIAAVTRLAERSSSTASTTVTINAGAAGGASTAAAVLADTAKRVLDRNMNVKPELRLQAGDYLRLTVTRDLLIDPQLTAPAARPTPSKALP